MLSNFSLYVNLISSQLQEHLLLKGRQKIFQDPLRWSFLRNIWTHCYLPCIWPFSLKCFLKKNSKFFAISQLSMRLWRVNTNLMLQSQILAEYFWCILFYYSYHRGYILQYTGQHNFGQLSWPFFIKNSKLGCKMKYWYSTPELLCNPIFNISVLLLHLFRLQPLPILWILMMTHTVSAWFSLSTTLRSKLGT